MNKKQNRRTEKGGENLLCNKCRIGTGWRGCVVVRREELEGRVLKKAKKVFGRGGKVCFGGDGLRE